MRFIFLKSETITKFEIKEDRMINMDKENNIIKVKGYNYTILHKYILLSIPFLFKVSI